MGNFQCELWNLHLNIGFFALSSVASPICQEGQSERNFPIFVFSS